MLHSVYVAMQIYMVKIATGTPTRDIVTYKLGREKLLIQPDSEI